MKKVYYCIIKPLIENEEFYQYLTLLDEEQAEIHVYECEEMASLCKLYTIIKEEAGLHRKSHCSYCFLTNHILWIMRTYDDMSNYFDAYIYYNKDLVVDEGLKIEDKGIDFLNSLYFSNPNNVNWNESLLPKDAMVYSYDIDYMFQELNQSFTSDFINEFITMYTKRLPYLKQSLLNEDEGQKYNLKKYILNKLSKSSDYARVYFYSFILFNWREQEYADKIIKIAYDSEELTIENKWFLYQQMNSWLFVEPELKSEDTMLYLYQLYQSIYQHYKNKYLGDRELIPKVKRRQDQVIVITGQFLDATHGPTKTALDRCYILQAKMGKKVILINAAELVSFVGFLPFSRIMVGSYEHELIGDYRMKYEGIGIPFFQCTNNMPNDVEMQKVIRCVKEVKPYYIISIGSTLTADLCSNLVPVITISTTPSQTMITEGQLVQIGRKLKEEDVKYLKKCGKDREHVIEGVFSSSLKPQTHHFTRDVLGIPKERFVIAVVGGRLDYEVKDEFVQMFNQLYAFHICIVFIGNFEQNYKILCEKYRGFKENSFYLGPQEDVLACYECCDLYVNPKRIGGGTSAVEAMSKGLPVITMDFGDVAINAGKEFIVADYEEMKKEIIRYITDREYYRLKSSIAQKRAEFLCDSERAFKEIIHIAMKRLP